VKIKARVEADFKKQFISEVFHFAEDWGRKVAPT